MSADYEKVNEIIKNFKSNKEEAFEEVYIFYKNRVFFIGMQFFKNKVLAEEVVQETFLAVYKYIHQLESVEAFTVWIQKIAYQKCLYIKQNDKKVYVDLGGEMTIEDFSDSKKDSIEKNIDQREIFAIVNEEIQKMKPEFREVAYFRLFEDMSINEIAEILDIPAGTVKSRLSKIREILQKELTKRNINLSMLTSFVVFPGVLEIYKEFQASFILDEVSSSRIITEVCCALGIGTKVITSTAIATSSASKISGGIFSFGTKSALIAKTVGTVFVVGTLGFGFISLMDNSETEENNTIKKPQFGKEVIEDSVVSIPVYTEDKKIDFETINCNGCKMTIDKISDFNCIINVNLTKGEKVRVYVSNEDGVTTYVDIESKLRGESKN